MVLEGRAGRGHTRAGLAFVPMQMPREIALAIAGDAIAQNQIMHAPADIDRIDLDVAVVRERGGDVRMRSI